MWSLSFTNEQPWDILLKNSKHYLTIGWCVFFSDEKMLEDLPTRKELCKCKHETLPKIIIKYGLSWDKLRTPRRQALNAGAAQRCRQRKEYMIASLQLEKCESNKKEWNAPTNRNRDGKHRDFNPYNWQELDSDGSTDARHNISCL